MPTQTAAEFAQLLARRISPELSPTLVEDVNAAIEADTRTSVIEALAVGVGAGRLVWEIAKFVWIRSKASEATPSPEVIREEAVNRFSKADPHNTHGSHSTIDAAIELLREIGRWPESH